MFQFQFSFRHSYLNDIAHKVGIFVWQGQKDCKRFIQTRRHT